MAFTWSENMQGTLVDATWRWPTLRDQLKRMGIRGVLMRAPLWWQLESPLTKACEDAGSFLWCERENIPLAALALKDACIDAVVTDPKDAATFAIALKERGIPQPKLWYLIYSKADELHTPRELTEGYVVQEVHLYPGMLHA